MFAPSSIPQNFQTKPFKPTATPPPLQKRVFPLKRALISSKTNPPLVAPESNSKTLPAAYSPALVQTDIADTRPPARNATSPATDKRLPYTPTHTSCAAPAQTSAR